MDVITLKESMVLGTPTRVAVALIRNEINNSLHFPVIKMTKRNKNRNKTLIKQNRSRLVRLLPQYLLEKMQLAKN